MGFFGDAIENTFIKKHSSKTVGEFCALSREERAYALLSAAKFSTDMFGGEMNEQAMLVCQIMTNPPGASTNDCMAVYDMLLNSHADMASASKRQMKEFVKDGASKSGLSFVNDAIYFKLLSMRIIMVLLADRADKLPSELCSSFFNKMDESSTGALFEVEQDFISQQNVECEFNPTLRPIDEFDTGVYRNIISQWNLTGAIKHATNSQWR